ncbi:putative phytol kinase 3, chloroplastic-like [Dorcoceras hygrometricum]|nr:putative phytol kinase 3, chloroplastic-like [Dorcoceras hygrometricum]
MFSDDTLFNDVIATVLTGGVALSLLRLWEETAKRGIFDQSLNRKIVHVTVGLVFMLCWPIFSYDDKGAALAALIPGVNIIKMLLLGLGLWKDEKTVKSMSRFGDHRELIKGPLYYASTITWASLKYWRTSPIAIASICNLCAGDAHNQVLNSIYKVLNSFTSILGMADIVGRHFGSQKLPYNSNKTILGTVAMATSGFLASIGFMFYFSSFGYIQESPKMILGFLIVSLVSALVESHPLSTKVDDNLTVPLASFLRQKQSHNHNLNQKQRGQAGMMKNLYVNWVPPPDMNRNTEWFTYPGVWTSYILILFFFWLLFLSIFNCTAGIAWTIVNLGHFVVTYHFFHWKKGTPFADDQGIYNSLTWWEQIDNGKQLTRNRKFLTVVPLALYLLASHTTDYRHPMLLLNTLAVLVLVIAKFPNMHKVRIFGINGDL